MNAPLSKNTVRIIFQLNDRWRVVDAPPRWYPQWILQRKERSPSGNRDGWEGRAFCTTRKALARNIHEYCGKVHPEATAVLEALQASISNTKRIER